MSLVPVVDIEGYLAGRWALTRLVEDCTRAEQGHFIGEARCDVSSAGVVEYVESGELTFAGYCGPAQRRYRYLVTAPGKAEVCFADGRHFFHLDWRSGCAGARHRCGADTYVGLHLARSAMRFETRWRVLTPDGVLVLSSVADRIT